MPVASIGSGEQCEVHPMAVPDVSVVMPVYNAEEYVGEAIRSVLGQTISPERLELVVVDDGSTDGSAAVIAELAQRDPRVTVLTQENSGTPGGARNPGIEVARGTFLFFLDADDLLPEQSLQRMVDVAIEQGSDVVLGKLGSTDHRKVPSSMFKRTVLDADLIDDNVFNTLGPTKLIRREVVERLALRFPTDQTVGEDEPFMAAVYLNARTISVLADTDYYLTRYRTDGENLTLAPRDSASHAVVAMRVARVVESFTEPGDRRDALLKRPFVRPLARALGGRWLTMTPPVRDALAAELRSTLGHLFTEGLRRSLGGELAAKLDLLMAGDLEGLAVLIEHLAAAGTPTTTWDEGRFRRIVPAEVGHLFPPDLREVDPPKITGRLEDLRVQGSDVTVAVSLTIAQFEGVPDALVLRLRRRGTDDSRDLLTLHTDLSASAGTCFLRGRAQQLPRGIWDLYAVLGFGDWEKAVRIGADRSRSIEPEGASNIAQDPAPEERLVAYFTKGQGNLSVDSGAVLHKEFALAQAEGLTLDENGRAVLLVRTTRSPRSEDEYFGHLTGSARHGGRRLLPAVRLGERLVGLRLPLTPAMVDASLTVTSVLGDVPAPLPITGTEFWSARAAGFSLLEVDGGGVQVARADPVSTPPSGTGADRRLGERVRHVAAAGASSLAASRLGAKVKTLPVVGPASRAVVVKIRQDPR